MKYRLTVVFLFVLSMGYGQGIEVFEKELNKVFAKVEYWTSHKYDIENETVSPSDSLIKYNDNFENLLLNCTSSSVESILYDFKELTEKGLIITTSEDGLFRIYSWNTGEGGSMRFYRNVYQFREKGEIKSKVFRLDTMDVSCFFYQINDIVSDNKKLYITQSKAILSGALSYHKVKIFSIDDFELNDQAKLIKTKSGVRNQLGYEVDYSSSSNREQEKLPDSKIIYDKENKIISIPIILENGKITGKKIRYQFKGKYFERL